MAVRKVLTTLWRLLDLSGKVKFLGLLAGLFVTGCLEMVGMLAIFGFIRGLSADSDDGQRHGPVATAIRFLFGRPPDDWEYALWGGGLLLAVILAKNLQGMFARFFLAQFFSRLNQRLTTRLFSSHLLAPYRQFLRKPDGPSTEQVTETYSLLSKCFSATAQILSDSAILLMIVGLLAFVDIWLTLGGVVLFGIVGTLLNIVLRRFSRGIEDKETDGRTRTAEIVSEGIDAIIDVRLRNATQLYVGAYREKVAQYAVAERRSQALRRLPRSANETILVLAIVLSVLYVVSNGGSLAGALPTLAIFGFAGIRANGAMSRIHSAAQLLQQKSDEFSARSLLLSNLAQNDSERPQFDRYYSAERKASRKLDARLQQQISLENVSYTYPDANSPALVDVSMTIPRGSFVSFCGPSGGGKSTLISLILGMLEPQAGRVLCDGWSIQDRIRAWHRNIGYVSQNVFIAKGSIRRNVALGIAKADIDDEQVRRALSQAQALEFVEALPKGIGTLIGRNGRRLSGGQRQRLIIARALYEDPDILIFDEATAALDNITEREISRAIENFRGQKTIICVAHRLSTIRESDAIHVVNAGRIEASGTSEWLLANSPLYRELSRATEAPETSRTQRPPTGN